MEIVGNGISETLIFKDPVAFGTPNFRVVCTPSKSYATPLEKENVFCHMTKEFSIQRHCGAASLTWNTTFCYLIDKSQITTEKYSERNVGLPASLWRSARETKLTKALEPVAVPALVLLPDLYCCTMTMQTQGNREYLKCFFHVWTKLPNC